MKKQIKSSLTTAEYDALLDAFLDLYTNNNAAYDLAVYISKFLSIDEFEDFMRSNFYDIYEEYLNEFER